jgi:hypothetical protein
VVASFQQVHWFGLLFILLLLLLFLLVQESWH